MRTSREHKRGRAGLRRVAAALVALVLCAVLAAVFALPHIPIGKEASAALDSLAQAVNLDAGRQLLGVSQPGPDDLAAGDDADADEEDAEAAYEPGVVLVQLADGVSVDDLNAALAQLDCVLDVNVTEEDVMLGFVELPLAEGFDVAEALAQLQELSAVGDVQPNFVYYLQDDGSGDLVAGVASAIAAQATAVNDPQAGRQWALESVEAYEAWNSARANGSVTVAILDTGCMVDHEDLAGNIVDAYNAVTGKSGADAVSDTDGHGTHVCGIVAAVADNGTGVAGVSYNAGLLPIKVFSGSTASTAAVVRAYSYIVENAADYNIRVANLSLGISVDSADVMVGADYDRALYNAVMDAREAGILTVCSSGNGASGTSGAYLNFPSDYLDMATSVIALRQDGKTGELSRVSTSNYNMPGQTTKDLSAPGYSIFSTYSKTSKTYGYYRSLNGTSMAAPLVAGVAALVFAANPSLTAQQAQGILRGSATDLGAPGWDEEFGYGEVNARKAVDEAITGLYLDGDSSLLVGGSCTLVPSVEAPWVFSSSDPEVATVSQAGVVTGVKGGSAVITATRDLDGKQLTHAVTVFDVSFGSLKQVAVGETAALEFNESPDTGLWLIESSNTAVAKVTIAGGIEVTGVAPGTSTITATLASNGKLKVSRKVTVVPASIAKASVTGLKAKTYTGRAITQKPTVTLGGKTLKAGTDYTVAYKNNTNAGTATVVVTGKNNYKGTAKATFKIAQAKNTLTVKSKSKTLKAADLKKKQATVKNLVTVQKSKGAVSYANASTKAALKKFKVNASTGTITVPKGTKTGTFGIAVKVTAKGNKNYASGSKTVTVTIKVK